MTTSASKTLGIDIPIIQAPMAGSNGAELVVAVSQAGGLGSLPCALLNAEQIEEQVQYIRRETHAPFNLNFFCHKEPLISLDDSEKWRDTLQPYFEEAGVPRPAIKPSSGRNPLNTEICEVIERTRPPVVSFHFGIPENDLYQRIKATGCITMCSATTVEEAIWLASREIDLIIAQGVEAGGHRGIFLSTDYHNQPGTLSLVPQIVDNVSLPVIAAGGIADSRGINAAFALGATCVQMGSAFLFTQEAHPSPLHLEGLKQATDSNTALTNIFTGRPARGVMNKIMREIGPLTESAPPFPLAGNDLADLKAASEKQNKSDFTALWSGQASNLAKAYLGMSAADLVKQLNDSIG